MDPDDPYENDGDKFSLSKIIERHRYSREADDKKGEEEFTALQQR